MTDDAGLFRCLSVEMRLARGLSELPIGSLRRVFSHVAAKTLSMSCAMDRHRLTAKMLRLKTHPSGEFYHD